MIQEIRSLPTLTPPVSARPVAQLKEQVAQDGFAGSIQGREPIRMPRPGVAQKVFRGAKGLATGAFKLLTGGPLLVGAAPTGMIGLVQATAAKLVTGGDFVSHLASRPKAFEQVTSLALSMASESVERGYGLSMRDLATVEDTLGRMLAPVREDGQLRPSEFFRRMAANKGGTQAMVYLGPEKKELAGFLERLLPVIANQGPEVVDDMLREIASTLPAGSTPEEAAPILRFLLERVRRHEPPVFIDLDGNYQEVSTTEGIANQTMASIFRGSREEQADYFTWLNTRLSSYGSVLEPWLEKERPEVYRDTQAIKARLALPERTESPLWKTPPQAARDASQLLLKKTGDPNRLADMVVALDRDLVTGAQSHWVRLLRQLPSDDRMTLLEELADSWSRYQAQPGPDGNAMRESLFEGSTQVVLPEYNRETGGYGGQVYNRGTVLTDVIDRTLNGLGIRERKVFLGMLKQKLHGNESRLVERDRSLQRQWGYDGVDIRAVLEGLDTTKDAGLQKGIAQLKQLEEQVTQGLATSPDWALRAGELARHRSLLEWVGSLHERYGDPNFQLGPDFQGVAAVSEFYPKAEVPLRPSEPVAQTLSFGLDDGRPPLRTSLALEGGGGKGLAYPEALSQIEASLAGKPGRIEIDEFLGTSAGALTAGLLSAGYKGEELKKVLGELNFMAFNSDYFQLQSASDPNVRGLDRTGLFSMQAMYRQLSQLLGDKLGIHDRPVTFRDLPMGLKITSVVVSTDLPEDHPLRKLIGPDGQIVFSKEHTPDFDVVGCMIASAAVPMYFNSPQLHLAERGPDGRHVQYRMQMIDGGVVNNLPLDQAGFPEVEDKTAAVVLPVYYETPTDSLTTLSFDSSRTGAVDELNRARYQESLANFSEFLGSLRERKYDRLVLGLNLAKESEQPAPIVQGRSRAESRELVEEASRLGMPVLEARGGADVVKSQLPHSTALSELVVGRLGNALLDGHGDANRLELSTLGGRRFHTTRLEAAGVSDVVAATLAAKLSSEHQNKRFER